MSEIQLLAIYTSCVIDYWSSDGYVLSFYVIVDNASKGWTFLNGDTAFVYVKEIIPINGNFLNTPLAFQSFVWYAESVHTATRYIDPVIVWCSGRSYWITRQWKLHVASSMVQVWPKPK